MTRPLIDTSAQIAVREATKAHLTSRPNCLQVPAKYAGVLHSPRDLLEHNIALQMQGVAEAMAVRTPDSALKMAAE